MCDRDDLYASLANTVHDEERKAAQEGAPTVLEVRSACLWAFGNLADR
jgi:hypothetical protein